MTIDDNQGGAPNYFPNSFSGPSDNKTHVESTFEVIHLYSDGGFVGIRVYLICQRVSWECFDFSRHRGWMGAFHPGSSGSNLCTS